MSGYEVAHLDEIEELDDGRCAWRPVRHHFGITSYEAGEYAEVVDRLRVVVDAHPQYSELFYNLACCESLTGRKADAVDHLRRAIEMTERFRAYAEDDSDFDPIRDEPAFRELTSRQDGASDRRV